METKVLKATTTLILDNDDWLWRGQCPVCGFTIHYAAGQVADGKPKPYLERTDCRTCWEPYSLVMDVDAVPKGRWES